MHVPSSIRYIDYFGSGVTAANNFQRCFGQTKRFGQQFQNRRIGFAIFRGSGDADQQNARRSVIARQADAVVSRIGDDFHGQFPALDERQYLGTRRE